MPRRPPMPRRPSMPRGRRLCALPALLLAAVGTAARAQPQEEPVETPFAETLDVEVVNVDVWVTDREGRPVTGLTRDDFIVYRDGEPVPVTNFYAVEEGREAAPDGGPPAAPSGEVRRVPGGGREAASGLAPEHRLWVIVYVDNFNIHPLHRNRILPDLQAFLGSLLQPGDRAMLASYDRSLQVRQPFTDDAGRLYAVLDEMQEESGHALIRSRERAETLGRIAEARSSTQAFGYARAYAEAQMNDIIFTTRALERMIDSLAGLPGRKALIYVTSGVPMLAGEEMFHAVASRFDASLAYAEIPRHDTSRHFERVGRQATANRVVFYTLDASGLRGMTLGAAEHGSFMTPGLRSTLESAIVANEQSALHLLAEETGGRAIVNRNEVFPALREASADFRTFYSLGISNPHADERYHRIEVEVRREGVDVRHRRGYRSRRIDGRMIDAVRSALLYDVEDNPLGISARWGRAEAGEEGRSYVLPVHLEVPLRSVVLLPISGGRHEMRLKLYVGAVDERGDLSEVDVVPLGLRIAEEHLAAARGESFRYTHRLRMEEGRQKVALAILDAFGNQRSVVSGSVSVGGSS